MWPSHNHACNTDLFWIHFLLYLILYTFLFCSHFHFLDLPLFLIYLFIFTCFLSYTLFYRVLRCVVFLLFVVSVHFFLILENTLKTTLDHDGSTSHTVLHTAIPTSNKLKLDKRILRKTQPQHVLWCGSTWHEPQPKKLLLGIVWRLQPCLTNRRNHSWCLEIWAFMFPQSTLWNCSSYFFNIIIEQIALLMSVLSEVP